MSNPQPMDWAVIGRLETAAREDERVVGRIERLATVPAAVRFLSCEPLIGPLDDLPLLGIEWVIVGEESGPGARPMDPAWVNSIRRQCKAAGTAFFFKQWGEHDAQGNRVGKTKAGRVLDGRTWDELPEGSQ